MSNSPFSKPTILPIITIASPTYMALGRGEKPLYQVAYDLLTIASSIDKGLDLSLEVRWIVPIPIAI